MPIAKKAKIKLVPQSDGGGLFKVVDPETGRELSEAGAAARQAPSENAKNATLATAAKGLPSLCGEGDSWLNLFSDITPFPKTFFDILGETFPTRNLAFPGDTVENMLQKKRYRVSLSSGLHKVFVFSGGGNDLIAGNGLTRLVKNKGDGHGSANAADYVNKTALTAALATLEAEYRQIAREAKQFASGILMLTHGYDHAIPRKNGKWLGKSLAARGFAHDEPLSPKIVAFIVDRFNDMLKMLDAEIAHLRHVDVRGAVNGRWYDELHPKAAGARDVAKLFEHEISKLLIV